MQKQFIFVGVLFAFCSLVFFTCSTKPGPEHDAGITDGSVHPDGGFYKTKPFLVVTSGGTELESTNFKATVFISPGTPVGSANSASYKANLGPAGLINRGK